MLTHLDCTRCDKRYEPGRVYTVCSCGAPLYPRYDLARAAHEMRPGQLALREPSCGLVLRAPFTSIRGLILERYPRLRLPLSLAPWLPLTRYDSAAKIGSIRVPLLVMHGAADRSVPQWMGRRLYELAPEPKSFVSFPGADHQDFPLELMIPAVRGFLERLVGAQARS